MGLYAPIVGLETVAEYRTLQGQIVELAEREGVKGELDFSAIQEFLDYKYSP